VEAKKGCNLPGEAQLSKYVRRESFWEHAVKVRRIVSLGAEKAEKWGVNWIEIVTRRSCYFHPLSVLRAREGESSLEQVSQSIMII